MNCVQLPKLDDEKYFLICKMIDSFIRKNFDDFNMDEFFILRVTYSEKEIKTGTKIGIKVDYTIGEKGFPNIDILEHAKEIWNSGYIPIEIVRGEGAFFFGILKKFVTKEMDKLILIDLEETIYDPEDMEEYYEITFPKMKDKPNTKIYGLYKDDRFVSSIYNN